MSEMSKASAPPGGDPLEVMPDSGAKDDVLPGPPADVDPTDDRSGAGGEASGHRRSGTGAGDPVNRLNQRRSIPGGRDPLDPADTEGARTPGVGGSESGPIRCPTWPALRDSDPIS